MDFTYMGNTDNVISDHGTQKHMKTKPYDGLVENCENLAETIEMIGKYGITIVNDDSEVVSSYDLMVKFYAGVLVGLQALLDDLEVSIPDELLHTEINKQINEITKGT